MNYKDLILKNLPKNYVIISPNLSFSILDKSKLLQLIGNSKDSSNQQLESLIPFSKSKNEMFVQGVEQYFENFMPAEVTLSMLPKNINISDV